MRTILWLIRAILALFREPPPRRPVLWTHDTRRAVHEAGHAVAAWYCLSVDRVFGVTIEERGDTGGTMSYSIRDRWDSTIVAMAGLAAETIVFGKFRSGAASSDLKQVRDRIQGSARTGASQDCACPPFAAMFKRPLSREELRIELHGTDTREPYPDPH